MRLEREPLEKRPMLMLSLGCILVLSSYVLATLPSMEKLETNWTLSFAGADEFFQTGQATDFHVFLEDEFGNAIENATVTAVFDRPDTVHHIKKVFSRVEGGLYETEIVFSVPGTWIAMVEAEKGDHIYRNQILFTVDGSIVSEANRDPKDHFHLEQPLPSELQRSLNNIPVFNK
ncbi:FixH family protein [Halalkalibacter alkaliphilus]|uniref:FixH family protein n=1 Tax=Halalkalibacter alkaliphilus TaxID=2917993 RepID=A0A9X2CRV6_9BACI|nr:FixH family protein [Halalkalibacter alkaliphilus]MCL7747058.1 FixH family protein [Halalkalibacter alkaliphilus]